MPQVPDVIEPVIIHDRVHESIDKIHEWEHKAHLDENGPFVVFILAICLVVYMMFHKTQTLERQESFEKQNTSLKRKSTKQQKDLDKLSNSLRSSMSTDR